MCHLRYTKLKCVLFSNCTRIIVAYWQSAVAVLEVHELT